MTDFVVLECPHCQLLFQVQMQEINCGIFRHGAYKFEKYRPLEPHLSKEQCERLVAEDKIDGCGKPFRILKEDSGTYKAEICDYI